MPDALLTTPSTDTSTTSPTGAPAASTASTPSLIVTSGASRSNYANNVTTLNTATTNLSKNDPSIVDFLNNNKMPSDYNSRSALAASNGIQGYTGSAAQNTQLLQILQNGKSGDTNGKKDTGTTAYDPNTGKPLAGSSTSKDGSSGDPAGTSTTDTTGDAGTRNAIDPSLRNVFDTSMASLDEGINTAKTNLSAALSTLQNDPAASAAVNMIMAKYDQQIELMKNKNRMLLGSDVTNAARGGSLQYANEMESNFMSEEQDKAAQRVTDLITTETQMVLKAQASYKAGDVKAFDAASKALDKATKDKTDAINKLLTQTDKIVKEKQAQAKIDATNAKQKISDDIRVSNSLASTVADTIKKSGIKDQKQIDAYIEAMAGKSGISNPDVLRSAVVKTRQTQSKADLSAANINSEINKRNSTKSPNPKKDPVTKLDKPTTTALYGAGLSGADIGVLQQAIYKYGAQTVIDNPKLNDKAKSALESYTGLTRTPAK